jgi:hypothetical protein
MRSLNTHDLTVYALGAGTMALLRFWGPALVKATRPVAREAIKGGLLFGREAQRLAEEARAGIDDLTAEARAALESSEASANEERPS